MKVLSILCLALTLCSCASLNEDFDCPAPKGGSCKRMDEVYDLVNGINHTQQAPVQETRQITQEDMRVWVAPYEDVEGNYHPAKELYSRWQEKPITTQAIG